MILRSVSACVLAAGLGIAALRATYATESGAGHYITGTYAAPGAGIVPPVPGIYWSNMDLFYGASATSSLRLPVAGQITSGLRADFSSFSFTGVYVPNLALGPFTYAAGITLPFQYLDARATIGARARSDRSGGFGDMVITPAILGWHSGHNFAQVRLDIFAPTAGYTDGSLANIGMGYWTFTPTLAYTYLDPKLGLDLSANLGVDFNTRNPTTGYLSGALLHFDTSLTKKLRSTGVSLGLIGSVLEQIQDDDGPLTPVIGGFRGQSFSIGPVAAYGFSIGHMQVSSALRCAPEFGTRKRPSGASVFLNLSGSF